MLDTSAAIARDGPVAAPVSIWKKFRRWAMPVFALIVLGVLAAHAHKVDWAGAWHALQQYSPWLLLGVLALATASHALYGCFDLIGRFHTRHGLPRWETWAIAVTSYAFTLNLGSLVGGLATRARLYARSGLDETTIAQVIGVSVATNWLGYGVVAGGLFASGAIALPPQAHLPAGSLRIIGALMLLLAVGYIAACRAWQGRTWEIRHRRIRLPPPGIAVIQLCMSSLNWALMGMAIYLLLGQQVDFARALGVLMAASIVGVVMPLPGGIGVLEAVYLTLLSGSVPQGRLLGAVMAYRALYYLLPLAGGIALYLALERYAAAHRPPGDSKAQPAP